MQPVLFGALKLCHAGMNYGGGQTVASSGEIGALTFLRGVSGLSKPFTLFDVGANDGEYLQSALRVFGEQLRAHCFEPQSASFEKLSFQFGSDAWVTLRKVAVGKDVGTVDLFFDSEGETTASLHRDSISGKVRSESVHLTTVDQVCADDGIEHIDLLKIDTEGHEMEVLLGASSMIQTGRISSIQFEFGDTFLNTPYHFSDLWALLSPRYTIYRILRHGLVRVQRYSPDLEIYKIANFLCMEKK